MKTTQDDLKKLSRQIERRQAPNQEAPTTLKTSQDGEEHYRILAENMSEGAATLTPEGTILFCNPRLAQMAGRPEKKLIGSYAGALFNIKGPERFIDVLYRAQHDSVRMEADLLRADRTRLPVLLSINKILLSASQGLCIVVVDLSERKRTEDALRLSEMALTEAQRVAHLGAWDSDISVSDRHRRESLHWSDETYRIFGFKPGSVQVNYELFLQSVHPEDRARVQAAATEAIAHKRPYQLEHRIIRPDGSERTVLEHAEVIFDDQDRPVRLTGAIQDITERKQAEETIRLRASLHAALISTTSDGYWLFDRDGKLLDVNDAYCRMSGYSRDELLKLHIPDLEVIENREEVSRHIQYVMATGFDRFETQHRRKNGDIFDVEISASFWPDTGQFLLFARDITLSKRAQRALEDSEQRYRAIHDRSPIGIALVDSSTGRFVRVNPRLCEILGRRETQMLKLDFKSITHPDDIQSSLDHRRDLFEGRTRFFDIEKRYLRPDGSLVWARLIVVPMAAGREPPKLYLEMVEDITERKEAQRALQLNEQRYRSLTLATTPIVWNTAANGEVHSDIPGWRELTGMTLDEVQGWGWIDGLHPDDRQRTAEVWSAAVRNHSLYDTEYRVRRRDGEYRYMSVHGVPVLEEDGGIREWIGTCTDITARKQAEAALDAERKRFRDVLDILPAYVVLLTPDYHVPFANRFFRERFGESQGLRCFEHLFGRTEPCEICETYKVLKTMAPGEWNWTGPDGRHYHIFDFPFIDPDGSTLILETGIDVTERDKAEAALREASLYTRNLIEASPDPLVTISMEGKITDANQAAERATGVSRDLLIGSDFCDYFTDPELARHGYQEVFAKGIVRDYPLAIRHSSGSVTEVLYNAAVFRNEAGQVEGVFAAARDVSQIRAVEREVRKLNEELEQRVIQRTAQLEAANRELEAFSYSVSHDLRAPLRAINGFAKILVNDHKSQLSPEAQHYLDRIWKSGVHMGHLIDDLLAFSRLGRQPLNRKRIPINEVVELALEDLRAERENRLIEFDVKELPTSAADPMLLRQVFVNLLSNAIKFTRTKDVARIQVGTLTGDELGHYVDAPSGPLPAGVLEYGTVVFYVRDNGIGFDMRYASNLFGVFQRLHKAAEFEGTGVGLATVQRIVHRHGGYLWAEAEPDNGATFYFTLGSSPEEETEPGPGDGTGSAQ